MTIATDITFQNTAKSDLHSFASLSYIEDIARITLADIAGYDETHDQ